MTKKEAQDILIAVDVDGKSVDPIIMEGGNYEKSANYIMEVTGCDKEMAMEIAYEIYPPEDYERDMAEAAKARARMPKCPTCGSIFLERVGMFERWLTDYGCKPDTFVCKNCGYKW